MAQCLMIQHDLSGCRSDTESLLVEAFALRLEAIALHRPKDRISAPPCPPPTFSVWCASVNL